MRQLHLCGSRAIAGQTKRPHPASLTVTALDANGYKREDVPGGAAAIQLLPDCLYYLIAK